MKIMYDLEENLAKIHLPEWQLYLQIMYDLEENLAKIHLPKWQLYLPLAIGHWDMLSPTIYSHISPCFVLACQFSAQTQTPSVDWREYTISGDPLSDL